VKSDRSQQCILLVTLLIYSWVGMQAVHELGRVWSAYSVHLCTMSNPRISTAKSIFRLKLAATCCRVQEYIQLLDNSNRIHKYANGSSPRSAAPGGPRLGCVAVRDGRPSGLGSGPVERVISHFESTNITPHGSPWMTAICADQTPRQGEFLGKK